MCWSRLLQAATWPEPFSLRGPSSGTLHRRTLLRRRGPPTPPTPTPTHTCWKLSSTTALAASEARVSASG